MPHNIYTVTSPNLTLDLDSRVELAHYAPRFDTVVTVRRFGPKPTGRKGGRVDGRTIPVPVRKGAQ